MNTTRRETITHAAWAIPVIALAIAAPATAASTPPPEPLACIKIKHAGEGGHQWVGTYTDGTTTTMTNSEAMSGPFGPICRAAGNNPGAGK